RKFTLQPIPIMAEHVLNGVITEDPVILPNIQEKQEKYKNAGRPKHPVWNYFLTIKKKGEHDGAECLYCHDRWEHGKPSEMEAHLAKQCKLVP
ncbi:4584_t:CDS:1, partial [Funneliformis caledonium]